MSRSADRTASGAVLGVLLLLVTAAPAWPEEADAEGRTVAETNDAPVAEAPVLDLDAPVGDIDGPVRDLVYTTANEDGSLTDAQGEEERVLTLAADVLFAFDEAELTSDAEAVLDEAAGVLAEAGGGRTVGIDGYTDSRGGDAYNLKLSLDRAEAVEKALAERLTGVDVAFEAEGHGSADPVAPNEIDGEDNPEGRERNRRVEIRVTE
jgi:outer membrane protein OmpA-like peptidoglycan-associated protein